MKHTRCYFKRPHTIKENRLLFHTNVPQSNPDPAELQRQLDVANKTIETLSKKIESQEQVLQANQELLLQIKNMMPHMPQVHNGQLAISPTLMQRAAAGDEDAKAAAAAEVRARFAPVPRAYHQILPEHLDEKNVQPRMQETLSADDILKMINSIKNEKMELGRKRRADERYTHHSRLRHMRGYLAGENRPESFSDDDKDYYKSLSGKEHELRLKYRDLTGSLPPSSAVSRITYVERNEDGSSVAIASDGSIMRGSAGPSIRNIPRQPSMNYEQANLIRGYRSGGELFRQQLDIRRTQAAEGREPRYMFEQRAREFDRFNTRLDTEYGRGNNIYRMSETSAFIDKPIRPEDFNRYSLINTGNTVYSPAITPLSNVPVLEQRVQNQVYPQGRYEALNNSTEAIQLNTPEMQNVREQFNRVDIVGDFEHPPLTLPQDITSYQGSPPRSIVLEPDGEPGKRLAINFDSRKGEFKATDNMKFALAREGVILTMRKEGLEFRPQIALTKPGNWKIIASNRMDRKGYGSISYTLPEKEYSPAPVFGTTESLAPDTVETVIEEVIEPTSKIEATTENKSKLDTESTVSESVPTPEPLTTPTTPTPGLSEAEPASILKKDINASSESTVTPEKGSFKNEISLAEGKIEKDEDGQQDWEEYKTLTLKSKLTLDEARKIADYANSHQISIVLIDVKNIDDPLIADTLASINNSLSFPSLTSMSVSVAQKFAKHSDMLFLRRLDSESSDLLNVLAGHNGDLSLDSITDPRLVISDAFKKHANWLILLGMSYQGNEEILKELIESHKGSITFSDCKFEYDNNLMTQIRYQ